MLFAAMIFLTVGYTAVYAALHGNWQFWQYFFPRNAPTVKATPKAQVA